MIVADASAVIEVLLGTPTGDRVAQILEESGSDVHAPALLDLEVAQVLSRLGRSDTIGADHGNAMLGLLGQMPIDRHTTDPLLPRIWQLRGRLTAYDAAYVALAEVLRCPLITTDEQILNTPGLQLTVLMPS